MPIYAYTSRAGVSLEVFRPMSSPPPRRFGQAEGSEQLVDLPDDETLAAFVAVHGEARVFVRDSAAGGTAAAHADHQSRVPIVASGKLPIAPTLMPFRTRGEEVIRNGHRLQKHKIGNHEVYSDRRGMPIIDSNKTADVVSKHQGLVFDS